MRKLQQMLSEPENELYLCSSCLGLFSQRQKEHMRCPKAKLFIDYHGRIVARHTPSANWDLNQVQLDFLLPSPSPVLFASPSPSPSPPPSPSHVASKALVTLRARRVSWCDIFWKFWGVMSDMRCSECRQMFAVAELGHCAYHAEEPVFDPKTHLGKYKCCQANLLRFDTLGKPTGCRARNHVVDTVQPHHRYEHLHHHCHPISFPHFPSPSPSHSPSPSPSPVLHSPSSPLTLGQS